MLPERRVFSRELNPAVHSCSCRRYAQLCRKCLRNDTTRIVATATDLAAWLQVFAKLSVLLAQRIQKPAQLVQALQLLLHLYRLSNNSQQAPGTYPVLVEILRAGSGQLGAEVVQTAVETVAVILRRDALSCGPLVDLGIVM